MNQMLNMTAQKRVISVSMILIVIFSTGSIFAFSDMNDSLTLEEVSKLQQKRIDSLEVRFEKMVIERNESKKSVFDWNRGLYAKGSFDLSNFSLQSITSIGYMFNKTRKNNRKEILSPSIRFGDMHISLDGYQCRYFFTSIGFERFRHTAEHVSFLNGIHFNLVPDFKNHELFGAGIEYANSIDFWYSESSALGVGIFASITEILGEYSKWYKVSGTSINCGARITYTQGFLKHNAKNRSK